MEGRLGVPANGGERVLARARRYVEIETPSGNAERIIALAGVIEEELTSLGGVVERLDAPGFGRNLLAGFAGVEADAAPVVILTHMDTVHPVGTLAARPFRVEGGRAYGPGLYDMKAGLATAVEALAGLHEAGRQPRRPVQLLVTCDEEIGSHSAHDLILQLGHAAAAVLVPEPCLPNGGIKTFRKGVATYRIEARGRAAHAGIDGASAVSATAELVHALSAALDLADHERGTTLSIGLAGGGTASNVIAAEAWAILDVRLAEPDEGERLHAALMGLQPRNPAASLRVTRPENRPPLVRTPAVASLYQRAAGLAAELGVDLLEGGTGGGSDGSIAASTGAATLDGLGPLGGGAHADDEHIVLSDLPFRLALMTRLLENL
jgi:glutamate carboxypeptidase